ncbi:MAG TPA: universal stress protein [Thermomicrobiales bacterium]|nr:universal stress protein [Thermomicrobiales bacterium]
MSQTIVVPLVGPRLDPDDVSEHALPLTKSLARANAATVMLVSALDLPGSGPGEAPERGRLPIEMPVIARRHVATRGADPAQLNAQQQVYLDGIAASFDCPVETRIEHGDPSRAILRVVDDIEDPVIVMASHGRAGVRRLVQGSVAFNIVRAAPCPVIVVASAPNEWVDVERPALSQVLIPLDGSLLAEYILEAGLAALGPAVTTVHLLQVIDPESSPSSLNVIDFIEETSDEAEDYIDDVASHLSELGYEVICEVRAGSPEQEILDAGREARVDIIALATHGREGLSRVFFGSISERLAQSGTFPILLARPSDEWLAEMDLSEGS